ncbi:MAG: ribosome silencing factor [Peptococcaceae bacterium]|nr:MAG: ribosome silencing factor [Peptococcaceae bacterium]
MSLSPQATVNIAVQAAEEKKAFNITVLDIKTVSIVADYFIICSGRSNTHVQAIAESIQKKLKETGTHVLHLEGVREGRWILLDYGDVVVHVFQEAERQFYNLERLWGDAEVVDIPVNI